MKVSPIGPSVAKPTKGELLARVETLSQKSRSVKRKSLDSVEKDRSTWGKVLKLGESSSSPSTHVRTPGQMLSPPAEVLKALSSQSRFGSTKKAKGSSGRAVKQPLAVMSITVWNPSTQSVKPPSSSSEEFRNWRRWRLLAPQRRACGRRGLVHPQRL